ncbi:MAG: type I phosphomannose isomerase catalytic subunit [Bacteroidota bacterium]
MLKINDTSGKAFAEYWLGVHPQADCKVILPDGSPELLRDMVHDEPVKTIGEDVYHRFSDLPYLLKALM